MNRYKIISLSAAAAIIVAGLLYLYVKSIPAGAVLLICSVALCVMGGANAAEVKATKASGFPAYIPAICFALLAAFVFFAGIFWFINK